MTAKRQQEVLIRLSPEVLEKIDGIVRHLRTEKPGLPVSRSGVVRMLLESALAAYEGSGSDLSNPSVTKA